MVFNLVTFLFTPFSVLSTVVLDKLWSLLLNLAWCFATDVLILFPCASVLGSFQDFSLKSLDGLTTEYSKRAIRLSISLNRPLHAHKPYLEYIRIGLDVLMFDRFWKPKRFCTVWSQWNFNRQPLEILPSGLIIKESYYEDQIKTFCTYVTKPVSLEDKEEKGERRNAVSFVVVY